MILQRKCILIVLDGWGIGHEDDSNPIYVQKPKNIEYIKKHFPTGSLQASGISVGLPWGEEGNSEVGHLTIGAGKVIYQHYPRITMTINDGSFFKNPALMKAIDHTKEYESAVNVIGLLGGGSVHSSLEHLIALLKLMKTHSVKNVNLHLFADGKDSAPRSVRQYLNELNKTTKELGIGKIASITGRYYAMDRAERWELIEQTYKVLTGQKQEIPTIESAIEENYASGFDDEFIKPTLLARDAAIKSNDALVFFNFREDSIREICEAFTIPQFTHFTKTPLENLHVVTFTHYASHIPSFVAFPAQTIENPLGKILSEAGVHQVRIAESEKYPHVTYFFNGLNEPPYENEYSIIIPSEKTAHHDEHPEMMSEEITKRLLQGITDPSFSFIFVNYANSDIIAHSGNYDAALKAVDSLDIQLGRIVEACLKEDVTLVITADHGNLETMIDSATSRIETKHNPSPVPFYLVDKRFKRENTNTMINKSENQSVGTLADVAPTVLEIMGIPQPISMTGQSLLKSIT